MTKLRLTIAVLFLVAFAAGVTLALSVRQWQNPPTGRGSWMAHELNLSSEQQEAMAKIWGEVGRDNGHDDADRRKDLQHKRDEAIRQLVAPEHQAELDKVFADYSQQMAELSNQRRRAFDRAVEKTKTILTDEQRKKYEQILSHRAENHRAGGWGHSGGSGTTTAPATQPGKTGE